MQLLRKVEQLEEANVDNQKQLQMQETQLKSSSIQHKKVNDSI